MVTQGIASTEGLRASSTASQHLRYFKMMTYGCCLLFSAEWWSSLRETPIWLTIKQVDGENWVIASDAKQKLQNLAVEEPPRLFEIKDQIVIPLYPKTGCERQDVVADLVQQIHEIINLLAPKNTHI